MPDVFLPCLNKDDDDDDDDDLRPEIVLITRVTHPSKLHFAVALNIVY